MKKIILIVITGLFMAGCTSEARQPVKSADRFVLTGAVVDKDTGLMWQDNRDAISIRESGKGAIKYCKGLNLAGYNDWRLPTIKELKSIIDSRYYPKIKKIFKYTSYRHYRSSTIVQVFDIDRQQGINFGNGTTWDHSILGGRYVRCVRGRYKSK